MVRETEVMLMVRSCNLHMWLSWGIDIIDYVHVVYIIYYLWLGVLYVVAISISDVGNKEAPGAGY